MKIAVENKKKLKRVLVIDDDKDVNDAFYLLLTNEGYAVAQTYNGEEALKAIPHVKPEIILLDLLMPVMDGKQFLKAFDNNDHIPIIVFSSMDSSNIVSEALELGATRFMLKSWATPDELFKVIDDYL
jgi:adenylate cyclase